jgi:hypothetical protein
MKMLLTSIAASCLLAGLALALPLLGPTPAVPVLVKTDNVDMAAVLPAETLAAKMFASAGIKIDWCYSLRSCQKRPGLIVIDITTSQRSAFPSAALAVARPYEGTHIEVAYDRIQAAAPRSLQRVLLAHVLVHEVTHMLQSISRHSETGVMKARWDEADYVAMLSETLPFTAADVELIHVGLQKRVSKVSAARQVEHR